MAAGSLVGIVTRVLPERDGIRMPADARYFSLLQDIQTGWGVYPASYSIGTWGQAATAWRWPRTAISVEVINEWNYTSMPSCRPWGNCAFIAGIGITPCTFRTSKQNFLKHDSTDQTRVYTGLQNMKYRGH